MKRELLAAAFVMAAMSVYSASYADVPDNAVINGQVNYTGDGGAISNISTPLNVGKNVQFTNNTAVSKGGAIYNYNANLTIGENSKFIGNNAIYHGGAITHTGTGILSIGSGAEFTNNGSISAFDYTPDQWTPDFLLGKFTGTGGGLDYESPNNLIINQAAYNSNKALEGGGLFVYKGSAGTTTITDTIFNSNAAASAGGAIAIQPNAGLLNVSGSTYNNNTAYAAGGAIWTGVDTEIKSSTFTGNKATATGQQITDRYKDIANFENKYSAGLDTDLIDASRIGQGGGALFVGDGVNAVIEDSTFNNNSSQTVGGAIATHTNAASLKITDTSFFNNSAVGNGGAIYATTNLDIKAVNKDVNFTGNKASNGADIYFANIGKTLALDVAGGKTISFDGGIDLNSGNLNITNAGSVILDAALSNAASINLASGSGLVLGENFNLSGTPDVTIAGALNSQNDKIDTFNVNDFTGGGYWDLDVDLANGSADYFNISGNVTDKLTVDVDKIKFLSGSSSTSDISIDVSNKEILNALNKKLYVDDFKLNPVTSDGNTLVFEYISNPIAEVLTNTGASVLNLTKDYIIDALGSVEGTDLIVQSASNISIIAKSAGIGGFDVAAGKGLTLNNLTIDGFTNGVTNAGGNLNLINTSFKNSADAAIKTNSDLTVTADNGNSLFSGNANAVDLTNGANLTLDAKNNGVITLDDSIKTDSRYNLKLTGNESGIVNINNSIGDAAVELTGTTLRLGDVSYLNNIDFTANSGLLDMRNGGIEALSLGSLTLNNNLNLAVNADLAASKMDTISAGTYNFNGNNINISNITLLNDSTDKLTTIQFADDALKGNVTNSVSQTGYSPIYKYGVDYNSATGAFTFDRSDNSFNPAVMVAPVAAQLGGYFTQLNSYDEAFKNLDMKMLMTRQERQTLKMMNKYAYSGDGNSPMVFSPLYLPEKQKAGWFRPYATFENVGLKGGSRVGNNMYGSFFGADSDYYELKNGAEIQYSVYAGYNGSHQTFQGNSIYQNGGTLGASALLNKGNFYTALTANASANMVDASTMYGSEDFAMLMAGIASKTGYNWELAKGKFIIQPNLLLSYSFVNAFDYTNAAGVRINANPLNAIHLAPGIKFIGNLKNGWQPYAAINVAWNIMDTTQFKANDVSLPELSVKPYVEYGVGMQKRWGDRFTGFGQVMLRSGGRNGVAMSCGLRFALGKAPEKTSYKPSTLTMKPTEIKLSNNK